MDLVTTGMMSGQSKEATEREEAARPNGRSTAENMADLVARWFGRVLTDEERSAASNAIHWALGIVPGAAYGVLRRRVPLVGAARGLVFGAILWAVNDEYAATALGIAAPPDAYPVETHARGLVGHLVLGGSIDTVVDVLGG